MNFEGSLYGLDKCKLLFTWLNGKYVTYLLTVRMLRQDYMWITNLESVMIGTADISMETDCRLKFLLGIILQAKKTHTDVAWVSSRQNYQSLIVFLHAKAHQWFF